MNPEFYPEKILNFCPRCGSKQFNVLNPKAKKCDDCNFIYYSNASAATAAIIRDSEGKILFARRAFEPFKGSLDLPGGFVDPNETLENTLTREIKEELNLTLKEFRYWKSFPNEYFYSGLVYFTLDLFFLCEVESFEPIQVADDVTEFEFLKPTKELIDSIGLLSIKKIIKEYIKEFGD